MIKKNLHSIAWIIVAFGLMAFTVNEAELKSQGDQLDCVETVISVPEHEEAAEVLLLGNCSVNCDNGDCDVSDCDGDATCTCREDGTPYCSCESEGDN